ncbi:MAG: HD domain-containing protein, partial [Candidatus Roseilinea sp.]|uniref:HD domain-containing protein n=1 Tax=Candidatus Roseilinea sp. TaxID=2838777 RepID=UPI00404B6A0B
VKVLNEDEARGKGDEQRVVYRWETIESEEQISAARVIVVHPALAGYSPLEGFLPDRSATAFISTIGPQMHADRWEGPSYALESYADHIQRVLKAFQELALPELCFAAPALERAACWPPGSVLRAAWLVCLLHDVGKLSVGWQAWARAYQRRIGQPVQPNVAIAHTSFDRRNPAHQEAEAAVRAKHPKPRHASEGALACAQILASALDKNTSLVKAALTAIARHHTPFAQECQQFRLRDDASDHIRTTLAFVPDDVASRVNLNELRHKDHGCEQFRNLMAAPDDDFGWMAYTLLVRVLRRADQRGTEMGSPAYA